jgi:hypothetical protein
LYALSGQESRSVGLCSLCSRGPQPFRDKAITELRRVCDREELEVFFAKVAKGCRYVLSLNYYKMPRLLPLNYLTTNVVRKVLCSNLTIRASERHTVVCTTNLSEVQVVQFVLVEV